MKEIKDKVDLEYASKEKRDIVDPQNAYYNIDKEGIYCDPRVEATPERVKAGCEVVFGGRNNNYIVLGRDRPGRRDSGYGGSGDTHASMIDLVAGMQASEARDGTFIDPDFQKDAARIYISQKTDIDENFRLNGVLSEATAAIGLMADNIRIASREYVKITAGTGSGTNSRGHSLGSSNFGVHLIANNDATNIQPIPRGNNLASAMKRMVKHVENLHAIVERILKEQDRFNKVLTHHVHFSPFGGITSESPECMLHGQLTSWTLLNISKTDLRLSRTNLGNFQKSYLEHGGKFYINSYYNKVN